MPIRVPGPSLLLGSAGLGIDGGIASVSRCVARAFDEICAAGLAARADRVLLHDRPEAAPPSPLHGEQRLARGSQARFALELWRIHRRYRHDLVLFDLVGLARTLRLPLPGLPRRYAVFVHGLELLRAGTQGRTEALRSAWRVLVNSEFTREWLLRDLPELRDRVRVAVLCIDPARVARWEAARSGPVSREQAVLIVGRMKAVERGKGHDALLEAWPRVLAEAPEAALWVVGDGDDRKRLEAKAGELGVADSVHFLGHVSEEELLLRYGRAWLFAMPSRQEGFGLVYAEAMWHGLPCVGSTADAASEVVQDGRTGLLVPYGEPGPLAAALVRLLGDAQLRDEMGRAGRERARGRFGYERFRDDLLRALDLPVPAG